MIYIELTADKKQAIERIYWDWFSRYHLKDFQALCEQNNEIEQLLNMVCDGTQSTIDEKIKSFLLSDYKQLCTIVKKKIQLKSKEKLFFLNTYENFRKSQAGKIIEKIGVKVCPYCNQNYLNIIRGKNSIRFLGDMDHFFPKSESPELAICLYNLVPVCKVCNQIKSNNQQRIVYPYVDIRKESGIKFQTSFNGKYDFSYLNGKSMNFNIEIDKENLLNEEENEIKVLKLEERYNCLKEEAKDIIFKSQAYHKKYLKVLEEEMGIEEEEIKKVLFGYSEDHLTKVLSKFNFDIAKEFEVEE